LFQSIDPEEHATRYFYDKANRQTKVTNPMDESTSSVYYPDGQLKRTIDAGGIVTTSYVYDAANRQVAVINGEGQRTTSVYYADGQIKQSIDPKECVTSYTYDKANRQLTVTNGADETTASSYYVSVRRIAWAAWAAAGGWRPGLVGGLPGIGQQRAELVVRGGGPPVLARSTGRRVKRSRR
jgi:YD repeat-containing protein